MTDRERFVRCILGEPTDRPPYWLFWGPWGRTWARWEREGKPPEVGDHRSFLDPDAKPHVVAVNYGPCPRFPEQVLEEDDDYVVHTDHWGIVRRDYKRGESMCQFLRFPVADRSQWERYKAERLDPRHPDRLAGPWREQCRQWMDAEVPIQLGNFPDVGIFGSVRWLLGDEECLLAFYTDPELVRDIMAHMTELYLAVFQAVADAGVRVDVIHVWEDMCGRQGPLISPAHWREFMGPCYRRIKAFAEGHGIPILSVDTDGDPTRIVEPMMEAGVNYLWPLEVAAGCDVNVFRDRFPALALMGGIDKRALARDRAAIDAELDRVWPAVEKGRYIPALDHGVPDDVPWENYRYYATELRRRVVGG
ncbi:MAG: uroporphyrinogen decarboxylase family protein [Candidatus Brocadiia bacterium]